MTDQRKGFYCLFPILSVFPPGGQDCANFLARGHSILAKQKSAWELYPGALEAIYRWRILRIITMDKIIEKPPQRQR